MTGSRKRVWYKSCGERATLIIRRLYCERCRSIHHELPDLFVPYRRYDASSIEGVVAEKDQNIVAADESTIARWRSWFLAWSVYAVRCLAAIAARFALPVRCFVRSLSVCTPRNRTLCRSRRWVAEPGCPAYDQFSVLATDPFCILVRRLLKLHSC